MNARFSPFLPPPPPVQAAIYARVSSDQQAERHTIDSQISDLKAHAAQDGHAVPDEYLFIDNGVSGTGLVRPALERLRDLIALSAIDIVYVHAPDRLARSYAHQVILIEEFTRAGVQVIFPSAACGHNQRRHRSHPRQIDFKEMAAPPSEAVNHRTRARSTWPLSVICTGMR
jgi:DNA invertase Pin-like site-specific DNA recombinase